MKTTTKKLINTTSVKVQFMTSSKDFTAIMAKYWVAINEMADKNLILRNNIKVEENCLKNHENDKDFCKKIENTIANYHVQYDAFKKDYDERIKSCYKLLTDELYNAYTTSEDEFKKAIKEWFSAQKIDATPTLVSFMTIAVGYKNSSNKQLFKTGNALSFKGKQAFNKSFMCALSQLMKDKNALKTDAYKYQYQGKNN